MYIDCHFYAFCDQTTKMVHINLNLFDYILYAVSFGFLVKVQFILHQVMIFLIETLSLHVIFFLIPLCRTKNKGNKRSL